MDKKNTINIPSSGPQQAKNFSELNFKQVDIWGNKIAWTFFYVNLNEMNNQLWAREYPACFYVRTQNGTICKIFKPNLDTALQITRGDEDKAMEIVACPTKRCIFDPEKKQIVGIENDMIRCGESFAYAKDFSTSTVQEIVGVSSSMSLGQESTHLKSSIEKDYKKTVELFDANKIDEKNNEQTDDEYAAQECHEMAIAEFNKFCDKVERELNTELSIYRSLNGEEQGIERTCGEFLLTLTCRVSPTQFDIMKDDQIVGSIGVRGGEIVCHFWNLWDDNNTENCEIYRKNYRNFPWINDAMGEFFTDDDIAASLDLIAEKLKSE